MNRTILPAAALALMLSPLAAQAATTIYSATGDAIVDIFGPVDFDADFFDLDDDGIDVAAAVSQFAGIFDAALLVSDMSGPLLASDSIVSVDIGLGTLTATFDSLSGPAAGLFGDTATAIFSFDPDFADGSGDEFRFLLSGVGVDIVSDIAPIPLPASLPLLLAGLGGIALLRARRA